MQTLFTKRMAFSEGFYFLYSAISTYAEQDFRTAKNNIRKDSIATFCFNKVRPITLGLANVKYQPKLYINHLYFQLLNTYLGLIKEKNLPAALPILKREHGSR